MANNARLIFIDRRKAVGQKSSGNRQRLLRRLHDQIRSSKLMHRGVGSTNITGGANTTTPVKVRTNALEEPWMCYAGAGDSRVVLNTNPGYDRGDTIPVDSGEDEQGKGGPGDQGEDDFFINISREEFYNYYFADCELPYMDIIHETTQTNQLQHAGYTNVGSPATLNVVRSFKNSKMRRLALGAPIRKRIEELEEQLSSESDDEVIEMIRMQIQAERRRLAAVGFFDKVDLRYRKREVMPCKTADAVLFIVMDISGSMSEMHKTIARKWFALLYAFIKRNYHNTDIVFIAHHEDAIEMSEGDFFSTRINGGTMVSPALNLVNKIIDQRYNYKETNIYVCHASDGDNYDEDSEPTVEAMVGPKGLMTKIQYFSYVEVVAAGLWGMPLSGYQTTLMNSYKRVKTKLGVNADRFSAVQVKNVDGVFEAFKKVFAKKGKS